MKEWPQIAGYSFKEVLTCFPAATPIGVKEHSSQKVVLNPEDTYIIQPGVHCTILLLLPDTLKPWCKLQAGPSHLKSAAYLGSCSQNLQCTVGDKIIVLAEDDDTYSPAEAPFRSTQMECPDWRPKKRVERILFLGWRRDMHDLIKVLDKFVDQGSELWLYNEVRLSDRPALCIQVSWQLQTLCLFNAQRMQGTLDAASSSTQLYICISSRASSLKP